jgi:hypothetical protein
MKQQGCLFLGKRRFVALAPARQAALQPGRRVGADHALRKGLRCRLLDSAVLTGRHFGTNLRFTTYVVKDFGMPATTSIRIDQTLYDQAKADAVAEHRTIAGQVEFWAKVGRAALDNPDLPVTFIAESLASMAEPREHATPFVPRSRAV